MTKPRTTPMLKPPPDERQKERHYVRDAEHRRTLISDGVSETQESYRYRHAVRRAARMNLLDHGGVLTRNQEIGVFALAGFGVLFQGLFASLILGLILGMFGLGAAGVQIYKALGPLTKPIIDSTESLLNLAKANGMPIDEFQANLENMLLHGAKRHLMPHRLMKYAALTLLAGGAGSTWLGIACIGLMALSLPDILTSLISLGQGAIFLTYGVKRSLPDIAEYRFHHHPKVLMERVNGRVAEYAQWITRQQQEAQLKREVGTVLAANTMQRQTLQQQEQSPMMEDAIDMMEMFNEFAANVYE